MSLSEKQALVRVAVSLIKTKSQLSSPADMEAAAGVSAGSFARSFKSFDELIDAALASIKTEVQDSLNPSVSPALDSFEPVEGRKARTRNALIAAGKRWMSNGTFDCASIDDLVREAGVGKGSFFNHFSSRGALAEAVVDTIRLELDAKIIQINKGITDPLERILHTVLVSFCYRLENGLRPRAISSQMSDGEKTDAFHYHRVRKDLSAAMEKKMIDVPSLDCGVAAIVAISELGLSRLLDVKPFPQEVDILTRGLCSTLLSALGVVSSHRVELIRRALNAVRSEIVCSDARKGSGQR